MLEEKVLGLARAPCRAFSARLMLVAALGAVTASALALPASAVSLNAQLLSAARQNDLSQVARVLDQGAVVNSRNRLGKIALLVACDMGNAAMVAVLMTAGADINFSSVELVTPLMAASYGGSAAIVNQLIAAGAGLLSLDLMNKPTAIYAAGRGHVVLFCL